MAFYIDTASVTEAQTAYELGWVRGITTNPLLLSSIAGAVEDTLVQLAALTRNEIFYQLSATTPEAMLHEANLARELIGDKLVLKIPPTRNGFISAKMLCNSFSCCVTALFNPIQAAIASETGARFIAVYVNRASKKLGDGIQLVEKMRHILKSSTTEILAASIKTPDEAEAALLAGAHHVTIPFSLLQRIPNHDLSTEAVAEFHSLGKGISYLKSTVSE